MPIKPDVFTSEEWHEMAQEIEELTLALVTIATALDDKEDMRNAALDALGM